MDEKKLVDIVNLVGITSFVSFLDKYPDLKKIMEKGKTTTADWDILFTAAGVGFALNAKTFDKTKIVYKLNTINSHLSPALDNYLGFIDDGKPKSREELATQTGFWMVWNLLKEEPNYQEHIKLISLFGNFIDKFLSNEGV